MLLKGNGTGFTFYWWSFYIFHQDETLLVLDSPPHRTLLSPEKSGCIRNIPELRSVAMVLDQGSNSIVLHLHQAVQHLDQRVDQLVDVLVEQRALQWAIP